MAEDLYSWIVGAVEAWVAAGEGRSLRRFAEQSGVPRGTMSNVVKRLRPLRPEHVQGVAALLELDAGEAEVLADLVAVSRQGADESDVKRLRGRQKLLLAHRPSARDAVYVANLTTVRVRELSAIPGFRRDPVWIASRLFPPVSVEEAGEALALLERLHPNIGETLADVSTGREPRSSPSPEYQAQLLEAARAAVDLPREERYLQSWVDAVPESAIPLLRAEIDDLIRRVVAVCGERREPPTRLVQVTAQLVPLTRGE